MTKGPRKRKNLNPNRKPISAAPLATQWDMGADGKANRAGIVIESAGDVDPETGEVINPNNIKRARRVDMVEVWRNNGTLSQAQYAAAVALRNVWEATGKAPGWPDNDRVQSSPKPDHAVVIALDRIGGYHRVRKLIPDSDWPVIDALVLGNGSMKRLGFTGPKHALGLVTLAAALERLSVEIDRGR